MLASYPRNPDFLDRIGEHLLLRADDIRGKSLPYHPPIKALKFWSFSTAVDGTDHVERLLPAGDRIRLPMPLKPRMVSFRETYLPGEPVNTSATKKNG